MCLPYEGMSTEYHAILESYSRRITYFFVAEMAFKLLAIGAEPPTKPKTHL